LEDDGIMPEPSPLNPDDQAWFWTPEWQTRERQADESVALGGRFGELGGVDLDIPKRT
jgi:hypothetical protein